MRPIIRASNIAKSYRLGGRQQYATAREEIIKALKAPLRLLSGQRLAGQRRAAGGGVSRAQHQQRLRHTSILTDINVCGKLID